MVCLFLGQTKFHVPIAGGDRKQLILLCGLKRSRIHALNGCLGNYNKPFVHTSHLLFSSNLISLERLAAGGMALTDNSLSHRTGQRHAGRSVLSPAAPPPRTKLCCWENTHAEVITAYEETDSLYAYYHPPSSMSPQDCLICPPDKSGEQTD